MKVKPLEQENSNLREALKAAVERLEMAARWLTHDSDKACMTLAAEHARAALAKAQPK